MPGDTYRDFRLPLPRGLTPNAMVSDFGDPEQEIDACNNSAALFDFSFILRMFVCGPDANQAVSAFCGRDFSDLREGAIRYALHADADGYLLSDLTVWRIGSQEFEVMSGRTADFVDLSNSIASLNAGVIDLSGDTAIFAVQGPGSDKALIGMGCHTGIENISYFNFHDIFLLEQTCRIGRLGFTGLPGLEILCPRKSASSLWQSLSANIKPAGMIAADRIRLKAGLALFTQEFMPKVTAADAGLSRFRPDGDTAGDLMAARACRVSFSAEVMGSIESVCWSGTQTFPPDPGTLAVTSAMTIMGGKSVLGMGYLAANDYRPEYIEPTGALNKIVIIRRFGNDIN